MLDPSVKTPDQTGNPKSETGVSGPLVWVPFVEAIVPNVDLNKREMQITPPKGLLELNLRSHERSKKERRQLVRHTLLYFTSDYSLKVQIFWLIVKICVSFVTEQCTGCFVLQFS